MKTYKLQLWILTQYIFIVGLDQDCRRTIFAGASADGVKDGLENRSGSESTESPDSHRSKLLTALQTIQRGMTNNDAYCSSNQSVILDIAFQNARWKSEALLAVEVANLLTSLWRVKTSDRLSIVENDTLLYNIVRSNVRFSPSVFGSVICFERDQYRDYQGFCPYAFRDKAYNGIIHVKDISVGHDYLNSTETIWWREPRKINLNRRAKLDTEIYTVRLNQSTADASRNLSVPVVEYEKDGFWTRPYFDCFGGEIWMITFLAPFFNESNQFLGVVSIDVELSSIDINQCDAQDSSLTDGGGKNGNSDRTISTDSVKLVDFLGTHKCKKSTQCEPIVNQGFKRGSYRCSCKRGYYYPGPYSNSKAFNGSIIEEEYDKKLKGLPSSYDDDFDCMPCSEGCEECDDGSPCVYKVKTTPRIILITIDGVAAMLSLVVGAMVFIFRESKVFEVASPVFLEILLLGAVLMYSSLAAAYVDPSSLSCTMEVWLYQCGFFLVYGILALKVWRVSTSFRARSPRRVDVTEGMMAGRLAILCTAVVIYLIVWTLFMRPHVVHSERDLRFTQCSYDDVMTYVSVSGDLILLVGSMFLCFRVRNAPSAYNEARFITWAVYNAMFITCFVAVLRILTVNNTNPDILFATEFILIQMTATVTVVLLFVPKFMLLRKIHGPEISRQLTGHPRDSIQNPNGSCLNDAATLERENEDLKDEVKRLALKVAHLHSRLMKDKNKHLKSGSNSLCRVRASTMDDFDDGTLKKMSSSPVSKFLSSRV